MVRIDYKLSIYKGRSSDQIDSWLTVDLKNKEKLINTKFIKRINITQNKQLLQNVQTLNFLQNYVNINLHLLQLKVHLLEH